VQDGVAILPINGPLLKGYDAFICWWFGYFSVDRLQDALVELAARSDVGVIVFRFSSPGGIVTGIPETAQQIAELEKTGKFTVAFSDTMVCSAAYWLACHCGSFFATPSADIGSIGTYIALYDYSERLKAIGIKLELFRRGKYKGIGVIGKKLTSEEREFLDADVGRTNDRFTSAVRARRGKVADDTMQGQWFDGEEALSRNLVDDVVNSWPSLLANAKAGLAGAMRST
jgi:signal peptide peptidase SppA